MGKQLQMTLFQVILKLIRHFNLMDTESRQILAVDIDKYEQTAVETSDDKFKAMYGKLHKGLYVRLLLPFIFFIGVKQLNDLLSEKDEDDDFLND